MNNQGRIIEYFIEPALIFIIIGGVILGIQFKYSYFLVSILSLIALLYIHKRKKEKLVKFHMEKLKGQWGNEHKEERNFIYIRKLYDLIYKEKQNDFTIDDITWRDLNMNSIFSKIDHTKSLPGMQYLYNILRNPIFNETILKERNNTINLLMKNKKLAQKIQYPLSMLGKKQAKEVFAYFENGLNVETKSLIFIEYCLI